VTKIAGSSRLAVLALLSVLLLTFPLPAPAQEPEVDRVVELISQPAWHVPGDRLDVRVLVRNDSEEDLEGFRIQVAAHDRVTSRSDLHASFDGATGLDAALVTNDDGLEQVVPAGSTTTVLLDTPVADLLPSGEGVEGGVYPLSVRLYDATGFTLLDELTTHVLYYPSVPERPLKTVVVIALNDVPSRRASGRFEPSAEDTFPLEVALSDEGWLTGVGRALERWTKPEVIQVPVPRSRGPNRKRARRRFTTHALPALEVGLATTPRLLEELTDMSDGYVRYRDGEDDQVPAGASPARAAQRILQTLRVVTERDTVQTLLVPYANPDLPTLLSEPDGLAAITRHIALGKDLIQGALSPPVEPTWLFPPAGRLDEPTLEQLTLTYGAQRTFINQSSLAEPLDPSIVQCPEASPTFACAVRLDGGGHKALGYIIDNDVDARFMELVREGNDRLDLQNLLAETAMVHAELPGTLDRALTVVVPSTWHPSAATWDLVLRAFARAPWLETRRPDVALRRLPVVDVEITNRLSRVGPVATDSFNEELNSTSELIEHLDSLGAPASMIDRFSNNLLVAQSRVWAGDEQLLEEGTSFVSATRREIDEQFDNITVRGPAEITLTSRRGKIQLVVQNSGSFPVDISVDLRSVGARLEPSRLPLRVPEGTQRQLDIDAVAQTSGIFSLDADIVTPDNYLIERKQIRVRSTKFNLIALGLTVGALLFLVLFYATRALRRSDPSDEAET
jgi:Family of unknown function (DUF6049)